MSLNYIKKNQFKIDLLIYYINNGYYSKYMALSISKSEEKIFNLTKDRDYN